MVKLVLGAHQPPDTAAQACNEHDSGNGEAKKQTGAEFHKERLLLRAIKPTPETRC
jgi:hypothetical protein